LKTVRTSQKANRKRQRAKVRTPKCIPVAHALRPAGGRKPRKCAKRLGVRQRNCHRGIRSKGGSCRYRTPRCLRHKVFQSSRTCPFADGNPERMKYAGARTSGSQRGEIEVRMRAGCPRSRVFQSRGQMAKARHLGVLLLTFAFCDLPFDLFFAFHRVTRLSGTSAPPCALLISAACMKANISSVSSALTGGTRVCMNLAISTSNGR